MSLTTTQGCPPVTPEKNEPGLWTWSARPAASQLPVKTAACSSWKISGSVNQEDGGVVALSTLTLGSHRQISS